MAAAGAGMGTVTDPDLTGGRMGRAGEPAAINTMPGRTSPDR
jgi:hypothetical protein